MHSSNGKVRESENEIQRLAVDPTIANEFVGGELASWTGVQIQEHVNGRIEFWLNNYCLGYLHDPPGECAFAMLKFPAPILDELVVGGHIQSHTTDREGAFGWATVPLGTIAEINSAINLFLLRYKQVAKEYE